MGGVVWCGFTDKMLKLEGKELGLGEWMVYCYWTDVVCEPP